MKNYINPVAKVVKFDIENIITASGVITDASTLTGKSLELYESYYTKSDVKNTDVALFTW